MSSSIYFPLIRSFSFFFCSTSYINALDLEIETMVEIVGLAVKTCIVPTDEVVTGALKESKTDVFAKLMQRGSVKGFKSLLLLLSISTNICERLTFIIISTKN